MHTLGSPKGKPSPAGGKNSGDKKGDDDDDDDDDGISTKIDHTKDNAAAASAPPSYNDATQDGAQQVVRKTGIPLKAAIEILRLCDNDVERAINFQRTNLRDFIRIVDESL